MQHQGRVASSAGIFVLMALVLGTLSMMHIGLTSLFKIVQLAGFVGLGWVHVHYTRQAEFLSRAYFLEYLFYTLLVGGTLCILLTIAYYITDSELLMGLASFCAFVLPFLLAQTWFFYRHIPQDEKLVWTNAQTEPTDISRYYNNKIPIRFKLSRQYFDLKEELFPVTVSTWVGVGILFNQFADKYNKISEFPIELIDEEEYKYGWEFYCESLYGLYRTQLNPEFDVKKNGILRNDTIVARRIKMFDETSKVVRHLLPA
jgi:hypothetical protein